MEKVKTSYCTALAAIGALPMLGCGQLIFVIEGHADDSGSTKANLELGRPRAEAVREILVGAGMPAARLRTASVGTREALDLGRDEASREKNRRVHPRATRLVGDRS